MPRVLLTALLLLPVVATAGTPDDGWFRTPVGALVPVAETRSEFALGDVDGDNDIDVVLSTFGTDPNWVYLNDGTGLLGGAQNPFGGSASEAIILVDVDGDNDLDAVTANFAGAPDNVWLNNGSGAFTDATAGLSSSGSTQVRAFDVDGDLDPDLVFGKVDGGAEVYINQGSMQGGTPGTFGPGQVLTGPTVGMPVLDLAVPDLNDDGSVDLVVLRADELVTHINTAGTLGAAQSTAVSNATRFGFGRLNADNLPDFVLGDSSSFSGATWFIAQQAGGFNQVNRTLADSTVRDIAIADFNGDGNDDVALAAALPGLLPINQDAKVQTWLNFNNGVDFTATSQCLSPDLEGVLFVHSADMDGDGDPDLVLSLQGNPQLVVYLNGPNGLVEACCPVEATYFITRNTGKRVSATAPLGTPSTFLPDTFRRLRDEVMAERLEGMRLVDDYQDLGDDMLAVFAQDFLLLFSSNALLTLWEPNFQALLNGNGGNVTITAEQMNPVDFMLDDFVNQGSPELVQVITAERARLSPLSQFVGMDMDTFADVVFGSEEVVFHDGLESVLPSTP